MDDIKLIPKSTKFIYLLVHFLFISILFNSTLITPYNNILTIVGIVYCTSALISLAAKYKNELQCSTQKSMKFILLTTILAIASSWSFYKSPVGEAFELYTLSNYFITNKSLIGETYYEAYEQNKQDIEKLRELRKSINEDLNL